MHPSHNYFKNKFGVQANRAARRPTKGRSAYDLDSWSRIPNYLEPGDWPYPEEYDVEQPSADDGGGVRIKANSDVRILGVNGARHVLEAYHRLPDLVSSLSESDTLRISARRGEAIFVAVLTNESAVYLIEIETDADGAEEWFYCENLQATEKLAKGLR